MPMKTPGVYIVEKNAFPNAVVEVATAVPVLYAAGFVSSAHSAGDIEATVDAAAKSLSKQ